MTTLAEAAVAFFRSSVMSGGYQRSNHLVPHAGTMFWVNRGWHTWMNNHDGPYRLDVWRCWSSDLYDKIQDKLEVEFEVSGQDVTVIRMTSRNYRSAKKMDQYRDWFLTAAATPYADAPMNRHA